MKILNLIRNEKEWGANRNLLMQIYNSMILSRLKYGSFAYSFANKTNMSLIRPVHNLGVRIATGAYRTSPVDSIISKSCVLPFSYKILSKVRVFFIV